VAARRGGLAAAVGGEPGPSGAEVFSQGVEGDVLTTA